MGEEENARNGIETDGTFEIKILAGERKTIQGGAELLMIGKEPFVDFSGEEVIDGPKTVQVYKGKKIKLA